MSLYLGDSVYNDSQVTQEWVEQEIDENGKGIFFVDSITNSYDDVKSAYDDGKIIILAYPHGGTIFLPLTSFYQNTFYFSGVDEKSNLYSKSVNINTGWSNLETKKTDEIFVAEYGVTTYDKVFAEYNDDKLIFVKYTSNDGYTIFAPMDFRGVALFYFSCIDRRETNQKIAFSLDSNGWGISQSNLVAVDSVLDSQSVNPVTNAALYSVIGDVESLLAAL